MARVLNLYQLWLDDLFPRAKFTDGLAILEKLGHSKRLQTMRREWIDEGKARRRDDGYDEADSNPTAAHLASTSQKIGPNDAAPVEKQVNAARSSQLLSVQSQPQQDKTTKEDIFLSEDESNDIEDDLDNLLAESDFTRSDALLNSNEVQEGDFDDDMEAMAEFDKPW